MKMIHAMKIINSEPKGFMVSFELKKGIMLFSDHFPDKNAGEPLIDTEREAWEIAEKFAKKTVGDAVNIYVIKHDFVPVPGYREKIIENRK